MKKLLIKITILSIALLFAYKLNAQVVKDVDQIKCIAFKIRDVLMAGSTGGQSSRYIFDYKFPIKDEKHGRPEKICIYKSKSEITRIAEMLNKLKRTNADKGFTPTEMFQFKGFVPSDFVVYKDPFDPRLKIEIYYSDRLNILWCDEFYIDTDTKRYRMSYELLKECTKYLEISDDFYLENAKNN